MYKNLSDDHVKFEIEYKDLSSRISSLTEKCKDLETSY